MKYIVVLICMLLITIPISSIAETMSDNKTLKLNAIKSDCPQHNNPIHPCGPTSNWFGFSVSLDEEYAIVGAPFSSAYVYKHDGTSWLKEQKLTASGDFGYSVSIDGGYAIVGAPDYDTAYVFKRDGINWVEEAKLTASDSGVGDIFGKSVSISGDYAICRKSP